MPGLGQGQTKLTPACYTPAADGMVVDVDTPAAAESRRSVLGFLLERYPASICTNGGRAHPGNEFEDTSSATTSRSAGTGNCRSAPATNVPATS